MNLQITQDTKVEVKKRSRSANFSPVEKEILFNLIFKYRQVIENKRIDKSSNEEKKKAWLMITQLFNAQTPNFLYRSAESLKKVYENCKRTLNQKSQKHCLCGGLPANATQTSARENLDPFPEPSKIIDLCISEKHSNTNYVEGMNGFGADIKRESSDSEYPDQMTLQSAITSSPLSGSTENYNHVTSFLSLSQDPDPFHHGQNYNSQQTTQRSPQIVPNEKIPKRNKSRKVKRRRLPTPRLGQWEVLMRKRLLVANLNIRKLKLELRTAKKKSEWEEQQQELSKQVLMVDLEIKRKKLESLM